MNGWIGFSRRGEAFLTNRRHVARNFLTSPWGNILISPTLSIYAQVVAWRAACSSGLARPLKCRPMQINGPRGLLTEYGEVTDKVRTASHGQYRAFGQAIEASDKTALHHRGPLL